MDRWGKFLNGKRESEQEMTKWEEPHRGATDWEREKRKIKGPKSPLSERARGMYLLPDGGSITRITSVTAWVTRVTLIARVTAVVTRIRTTVPTVINNLFFDYLVISEFAKRAQVRLASKQY